MSAIHAKLIRSMVSLMRIQSSHHLQNLAQFPPSGLIQYVFMRAPLLSKLNAIPARRCPIVPWTNAIFESIAVDVAASQIDSPIRRGPRGEPPTCWGSA